MNFRVDKTVAASVALHVLVLGWGLISFQSKAFESMPEESLPVDVISADQLAKVMAGMKTGKKEAPKPLVEKVAEAKPPVDDTVGKITEKPPVVTESTPPPSPPEPPKVVEKKPDLKPEPPKPEPPKPVAEAKPKEEPKPVDKKPDPPKIDPIAEALKKEEKKEPPKPQQAKEQAKEQAKAAPPKPPAPPKPIQERHFDQSKIAALLDKREPSRNAVTGDTLNSNAALGLAKGRAADNSATWGALFRQQVERCWKKPYGGIESRNFVAIFTIKLKNDGTLESTPVPLAGDNSPAFRAFQESAQRGIIACQPYKLPPTFFEEWKFFEGAFDEKTI